jgi:hypothetical protein
MADRIDEVPPQALNEEGTIDAYAPLATNRHGLARERLRLWDTVLIHANVRY